MTNGKPDDWENTKKQLMNPDPVSNNKTWLNHRVKNIDGTNAQCGPIDLMVLEGKYSISEIAQKINNTIMRVKDHLEHLQDGSSRDRAHGTKPHNLKIVTGANDKVMFSSESRSSYKYSDIVTDNKKDYLPSKEFFESAYRMLTQPGGDVSLDAVLHQIEINAKKEGLLLKNNWRMITERNIEIWVTIK
jgi:hypothetical protein